MRHFVFTVSAFALCLAFGLVARAEAPLSGYQQKIHDEIKAGLTSVEESLAGVAPSSMPATRRAPAMTTTPPCGITTRTSAG